MLLARCVEAEALFVARAKATVPSFSGTVDTPAVRELVERLDGLPLAIELAAARVGVLEPKVLLARLPAIDDLRASADAQGRQGSVAAAVQWSIDLLTPDQRRALTALAALDASFDLSVADAAIAALNPTPAAGLPESPAMSRR